MTSSINKSKRRLSVIGHSIMQADCHEILYQKKAINAWESRLYRQVSKKTNRYSWLFNRFGIADEKPDIRHANYHDALNALSLCCKTAYKNLNRQHSSLVRKGKTAFIYFDSWGESATFESVNSWRDSISIDMLPKSIPRDHTITDFSFKMRGERNGFIQAIRMANDLLAGKVVDTILLCGLFRAFPTLVFSEVASAAQKTSHYHTNTARVIERVGCLLLRNDVETPHQFSLSDFFVLPQKDIGKKTELLSKKWTQYMTEHTSMIYGGSSPLPHLHEIEQIAIKQLALPLPYKDIFLTYGDSGCLNPLLALSDIWNAEPSGKNQHFLINAADGYNGVWLIECWQNQSVD